MSPPQPPMAGRPSPLIKSSPAPSSATATPTPQTLGTPKPPAPPTLQQLQQQQLRAQQLQLQAQNAQQQPQPQTQSQQQQQQPQHPPMKHPQSSLNTLPSMFHAVTADVFATPAATHPRAIPFSSKRLSVAVTTATERFHFGLDQLEMDIIRAKEVLRRDLAILQEKRRKEEEKEKEKVRAREAELQREAEERLRLMEEARKERDTTRPQQQSQPQLKMTTQQGNEQGKRVVADLDDDIEMVGSSTTGGNVDMKDDNDIDMLDHDPSIQQKQQKSEQTQQHQPQQDPEQDHPMDDDMDYLFGTDDSAPPSATVPNPPQHQNIPQAQLQQPQQHQQQQQAYPQPSSDFDNFLATVPNVIGDTGGGGDGHGPSNNSANSGYNQDSFSDLFDYAQ
ncbi:hypothetical protein EX30DRAFT_361997 [Ascodesmis nigricans]|uniref:Uncharacterized protein n=1 Tax=Ascodesmis nigricans TaxID=341454 RepID=A0A4S2N4F0_9PEZI|nr:hypothetical protein EX30DRAFT_361997 [Ascodesmis nigricans]